MHNKLLIRKLATEGLKMRRIKKVKCASPGQEQKKNCLPTLTFPNKRPQKAAIRCKYVTFSSRSLALSQASFTDRPLYLYLEGDVLCAYSEERSFSPHLSHKTSLFGQNVSAFGEKCPTFSAPLRAALATRHKKGLHPNHCTVLCLSIQT